MDNACYMGNYLGWQLFAASGGNDYSQCLDVLGHEFTHCVTGSAMTYNAYMNDHGAINEAMSDIQGKTCEMMMEGRAFWFTVDCAMAPGTDYAQLSELLPWALKAAGLQQYDAALRSALDATRLGVEDILTTFDADRALLTLRLPEQGIYSDGQWIMMLCTVNVDKLIESAKGIIGRALMGDYSDLPDFARQLLAEEQEAQTEAPEAEKGLMKTFMETFMEELEREFRKDDATDAAETPEAPAESAFDENDRIRQELLDWVQEHLSGVLYSASTNAGQDGQTMRLVSIPGYALPVLMHGVFNQNTSEVEDNDMLVYVGGQWIDINALMQLADEAGDRQFALPEEMDALFNRFLEHIGDIHSLNDALDMIFYRIEGGKTNEVPAANLKDMEPVLTTLETAEAAAELPVARKSRPKLEAVEEKEAA